MEQPHSGRRPFAGSPSQPLPAPVLRARKEGIILKQIHWQDRFGIGVELIDSAHRQLFDIVEKIMELYVERHEDRFACIEGIKYFKAYAVKHFAEEEAYMREILSLIHI